MADYILNSREEFCQPGEIIPVIPGREWRRNSGANNNSQSQVQQLQQSQPVVTSVANNNSQQLQQQEKGRRHGSSGVPGESGEVSQDVSGEGVKTRARARREREEAGVTTRSRAAHRGLQRRIAIKSHLVASLTIISNYINTINMVRLLSVELDSE